MSLTPLPVSSRQRVRIGSIWVDVVNFDQAVRAIEALVGRGLGGAIFTPNVDHVVKAESNESFRRAYSHADLSFADGMPLVWVGRLLGCALPERVAGSDLLLPLMQLAARYRWRVYLLGGAPGVAKASAAFLQRHLGVCVVGWDDCAIESDGSDHGGSITRVCAAQPDLVLVALGPPKQELWIERHRTALGSTVAFGIGASLDFLIGRHRRAPRWVSAIGFEWLFRLLQEPRRLWRRYLLQSPRFAFAVLATRLLPVSARVKQLPS
jgi:N-acetylglucosaminyldiphosphoundecaprenol N-acetyl-beta-D-mannosaminyltransferase